MDSSFDLDINNYSKTDLVKLFKLPDNYNQYNLDEQYKNTIEKIEKEENLEDIIKEAIIDFFKSAKYQLDKAYPVIPPSSSEVVSTPKSNEVVTNMKTLNEEDHIVDNQYDHVPIRNNEKIVNGLINPIRRRTMKKVLNINTLFRTDYNEPSSDFTMTLLNPFQKVVSIRLLSAEIPSYCYAISDYLKTNTFYIHTEIGDQWEEHEIIIPDGNYSSLELEDYFMNEDDGIFTTADDHLQHLTFTISSITGKTTIDSSDPITNLGLNFTLDENVCYISPDRSVKYNLGWLLGYREAHYKHHTSYKSEGQYNMSYPNYLYLKVTDFNNNTYDYIYGTIEESWLYQDILAKIPLQHGVFSINFENNWDDKAKKRNYFGPVELSRLKITLLDEWGRIVDLNKMDYSIALELECLYSK